MSSGTPDPALAANLRLVRERIAGAARRAGRGASEVTLVAATKTVPAERIAAVVELGVSDVGENRAQELRSKAADLAGAQPRWHFVGRLQRNKVAGVAPHVWCWQTVDRAALATAIARHAPGARVLVEVNVAGEPQKGGCAVAAVPELVDACRRLALDVRGLMTVPPFDEDPRRWFAMLRDVAGTVGVRELSMGMTDDFEIAVEEGATIVRVGRALFGARPR